MTQIKARSEPRDYQVEVSDGGYVWRDYWLDMGVPEANWFTREEAERYIAAVKKHGSPHNYRIVRGER